LFLTLHNSFNLSLCFSTYRQRGDDQKISEAPFLKFSEALEPKQKGAANPGKAGAWWPQLAQEVGPFELQAPEHWSSVSGNHPCLGQDNRFVSPVWLAELKYPEGRVCMVGLIFVSLTTSAVW